MSCLVHKFGSEQRCENCGVSIRDYRANENKGRDVNDMISKIPKGLYCYDENGRCPYWSVVHEHISVFADDYEPIAYCSFIDKDDRELGGGLLWDQCKECGIKIDYEE